MNISKSIPRRITINGRDYVDEKIYLARAAYTPTELKKAKAGGLPHHTKNIGGNKYDYFNLHDCEQWHAGNWEGETA